MTPQNAKKWSFRSGTIYIDGLKEVKFEMGQSSKQIHSLIGQIESLSNLIKKKEGIKNISEKIFKQRLNSIFTYFLLVGKRPQGVNSLSVVEKNILVDMERFLKKQWLIFEFRNEFFMRHGKVEIMGKLIKKDTIFPDDREITSKKDGIIHMCKVYRHYPFHIHENVTENKELGEVYGKLIKAGESMDIIGFKINDDESYDKNIKYINSNSDPEALEKILKFFSYPVSKYPSIRVKYERLIADLKIADRKNLERINKVVEDYKQKAVEMLSSIKEIKRKHRELTELLRDIRSFEVSVGELLELSWKIYPIESSSFTKKIKKERDNIQSDIGTLIKNLEKGKRDDKILKSINDGFERIGVEIDTLSECVKKDAMELIRRREFEYLALGEKLENPNKSSVGNFIDAAVDAFKKIKGKKMGSWADIIGLDKNDNIIQWSPNTFYKTGKIVSIEVPLLFKTAIETDAETGAQMDKYFVYLKAKIVFEMKDFFGIEDYGDTVKDKFNNILWAKDKGDYVVYKRASGQSSVLSLVDELNQEITEDERKNGSWALASEEDLKMLMKNEELFVSLNIELNRSYWVSKKVGVYYLTFKFQKGENGELVLIPEKRISSDGAYCIFVRRISDSRKDEEKEVKNGEI
jgi:hypothetical protein